MNVMYSGNSFDTRLCPLCGEANHCAMGDDDHKSDDPCWCKAEIFPQSLLHQVPEEERDRVCICKRCQQNHASA